jgi:hypothetical protein
VLTTEEIASARIRIARAMGVNTTPMSDDDIQKMMRERARSFLEDAPMTAAEAAKVILDGVKDERWRILVGEDAKRLDEVVRHEPERVYDVDFFETLANKVGWRLS